MAHSDLPIGVFDSGLGGLTVVREMLDVLPHEDMIYLGDTARVPYGIRSKETVIRYALEGAKFMISRGIKVLVIACNTVSAVGIDEIRKCTDIPVIGVIEPGARAAVGRSAARKIGVIGTEATIRSGSYPEAMLMMNPRLSITERSCPLFVPLVEEGWLDGELPELAAHTYLDHMKGEGIDALVLGCTHYPLLKPVLQRVMGPGIALIDSATETVRTVRTVLERRRLQRTNTDRAATRQFFVTDDPERFKAIGQKFLGHKIADISKVELEAMDVKG